MLIVVGEFPHAKLDVLAARISFCCYDAIAIPECQNDSYVHVCTLPIYYLLHVEYVTWHNVFLGSFSDPLTVSIVLGVDDFLRRLV